MKLSAVRFPINSWKRSISKIRSPERSVYPVGPKLLQGLGYIWGQCLRGSESLPDTRGSLAKSFKSG